MLNPETAMFSGSSVKEIFAAYNKMIGELPPNVRKQLASVLQSYCAAYGFKGMCERFKGRTVVQVLSEYREPPSPNVVASGERDGVKYTLYENQFPESNTAEQSAAADRPRE